MKKVTDWLLGTACVTVGGGSPQWCLNRMTQMKIPFWNLKWTDEFTVSFVIPCAMKNRMETATSSAMCQVLSVRERGLPLFLQSVRKRKVLVFFLLTAIIFSVVFSKFIWFYEVEGNSTMSTEEIVRQVRQYGVPMGTFGRNIDTYAVENRVLAKIPELNFLTVNQIGCKAKIIVREKIKQEEIYSKRVYRDVCAAKSGLVTKISVLEGAPAVSVGQMVEKGQLLISGFVDLEYKYRLCGANGEVYARTWYVPKLVMPKNCEEKQKIHKEKNVFYLCFGQKRIKISGDTQTRTAANDVTVKERSLSLPGGLILPVSFVKETCSIYHMCESQISKEEASTMLCDSVLETIRKDMVAGTVLEKQFDLQEDKACYNLTGFVECEEMIGRAVAAEIFKGEIQHDGKNY